MKTFTIESISKYGTNRRGKALAYVKIIIWEEGTVLSVKVRPIDYKFHEEIEYLMGIGCVSTA